MQFFILGKPGKLKFAAFMLAVKQACPTTAMGRLLKGNSWTNGLEANLSAYGER